MKKILYLTFYFEPDLSAGSFRNTTLVKELAQQLADKAEIDVFTTLPNRYSTFRSEAQEFEKRDNYQVHRIAIPKHQSGMKDQIFSFKAYFETVRRLTRNKKYDLVVVSSSRLFSAYLGYTIAKKQRIPLYLDIRDIFIDTMQDVLKKPLLKTGVMPVLKNIEHRVFNYATHINLISGGFESYFKKFKKPSFSFFPNGIDAEFLNLPVSQGSGAKPWTITYAGNIGEGQGLHKIIPQAAKALGNDYRFLVIGDGGTKPQLEAALREYDIQNVELKKPVKRKELLDVYAASDFLFMHLNDYEAFKKVLPSKVFELGAFDKPVIAGVAGYAGQFVKENIENRILFQPCDVESMVAQLRNYQYRNVVRKSFIEKFKRENINKELAASIMNYL